MNVTADAHPMSRLNTGKVALLTILGSESVFFGTLIVAYLALRDQVPWSMQHTFTRLAIPLLNTFVLLLSSIPAWQATVMIRKNKIVDTQNLQLVTLLIGLLFVVGQVYEFIHAGFRIDDQAFGAVFFTLMGFHALHVLAGMVFIVLNLVRTRLGDFSATHYTPIELGLWFWYYVIAVWLVLFSALYLL